MKSTFHEILVKTVFLFFTLTVSLHLIPSIIVHKSVAKLLKLPQNTTGKWHKQGITQSSTKLITVFFVASNANPYLLRYKKDRTIVARKISQSQL